MAARQDSVCEMRAAEDSQASGMLSYAITIFLSAFLLFQVQPMLAKYILPWFGGTPAVWTTCILFFQVVMLAGYAYAHFLTSRFEKIRQVILHSSLLVISLALMAMLSTTWQSPITPGSSWKPHGAELPVFNILLLLSVSIGLPYFILSTTSPLLQAWFGHTERRAASPYRLYALSNLGSLLALVSYPFLVEPALTLRTQARAWSSAYVAFTIGVACCAYRMCRAADVVPATQSAASENVSVSPPTIGTRLLWIALPACASIMLLASTNQICQEIAAVPFLWILPLVLYLVSFIICFDNERWYRRGIFHVSLGVALFAACYVVYDQSAPLLLQLGIYSFLLFSICMVCHGELVRLKPGTHYLTAFYLMVSLGGAIGGIFVGLIAPHVFRGFWEFYLGMWMAPLLVAIVLLREQDSWIHQGRPRITVGVLAFTLLLPEVVAAASGGRLSEPSSSLRSYRMAAIVLFGLTAVVVLRRRQSALALRRPGWLTQVCLALGLCLLAAVLIASIKTQANGSVLLTRNFYGTLAVVERDANDPEMHSYLLRHGRIVHGEQFVSLDKRHYPTAYYSPRSGIGVLLTNYPRSAATNNNSLRIGIIGLGVGTMSAYGRPGDYFRYYEINPEVTRIASDPAGGYFSYLGEDPTRFDIVPGDGRLSMQREVEAGKSQQFDVLAVDAFSGDTIPVHLLTREAFEIYRRELKPSGVLAIHISNRYLDLRPVLWRQAEEFKLHFAWIHSGLEPPLNGMSDWVLLAADDAVFRVPGISQAIVPHTEFTRPPLWTDDYSNLLQTLRRDQLGGDLLNR